MSENQNPGNEQKQTEVEQPKQSEDVISEYYDGVKKLEMRGYESGIRKARNALFVTAGLFLVLYIIAFSRLNSAGYQIATISYLFAAIDIVPYIGLAIWTKSKPYTAIIVGLILFILSWALAIALVGGKAIYGGIIIRIIILATLISALKPAKAWEDLKKSS